MGIKTFFQSRRFKYVLIGISLFTLLLLAFEFGVLIGFKKASFSYEWGEHYYRSFAGHNPGPSDLTASAFGVFGDDYFAGHGVFGSALEVTSSTLVVESQDGTEKTIIVSSNTAIMRFRNTVSPSDLNVGDAVVVIGAPNDMGQIMARLIRMVPPPDTAPSLSEY